jgi:hypothetical protein
VIETLARFKPPLKIAELFCALVVNTIKQGRIKRNSFFIIVQFSLMSLGGKESARV